jgi:hypothetical protein
MIKERAWPAKAMYILIAAALAISLIIMAAPADKVSAQDEVYAEWDMVTTPTTDGWVLAPNSTILDYALASDGEVAYAVVLNMTDFLLLKSDDHAATWKDITDEDWAANNYTLVQVATDWEDPEFVAVALYDTTTSVYVYVSFDGGDTFEDEPDLVDDGGVSLDYVSDLAVSYEDNGERVIAIGGVDNSNNAGLFRCTVDGETIGGWEDATDITDYPGWDNMWTGDLDSSDDLLSDLVTDIIFSPNWDEDKTILVTTVNPTLTAGSDYDVYLQCGTSEGWNEKSKLGFEAVSIKDDVDLPSFPDARGIAGMTLPEDYDSTYPDTSVLWVWVNYYDGTDPANEIVRVEDDDAGTAGPMSQVEDGEVWLTNISYQGNIAEGKAIAGVMGTGDDTILTACCEGVDVYRNDGIANMIICCKPWKSACKPPTGRTAMAVSYVGGDKAYAVNLWGVLPYDESAWSVTFDEGDTWNQLSLIDTHIDYFSDVAVSPDCNKTMLVSVNLLEPSSPDDPCGCDSVWLHADDLPEASEYDGQWIRTWCDNLEGINSDVIPGAKFSERGLLRLPPASEETTGETVFLVDRMSGNVYWDDLEGLGCWDPIPSTEVTDIVDLAVHDADTLFALGKSGKVSMFDEDDWQDAVDSEVEDGWTIAVWGDQILVGGQSGDVSYCEDASDWEDATFEELDDVATSGLVTVAFDSYFDDNGLVYAALAKSSKNNVYRYDFDKEEEDRKWESLRAEPYDYTGLVVDNADGNPKTSAETGGVIYASYLGAWTAGIGEGCDDPMTWNTGVARRLYPAEDVICGVCGWWDYLTLGLSDVELFNMAPDALKICGCLTADSNSKLFAIDGSQWYDMVDGELGTVWTFEDCYAKKGAELTSPADDIVVPADPCECYAVPFNLAWDRLCDACSYDIQIASDEDFTQLVINKVDMVPGDGASPSFHVPSKTLTCEFTYYWRVRAANAESCQIIHSWWSEPRSITVAPSTAAGEIDLVSPVPGATGVGTKNVGFSWDLMAEADEFDWVLDDNSDLSSPVESKTGLTSKAYECTKTLGHGKTYYWQVTAYNEGVAISSSSVGTFTTAAQGEFCCPQCGLCFDTQEELQDHIDEMHPAQPAVPFWVWVVIGIGAALVIVVIVLIFRTRRV